MIDIRSRPEKLLFIYGVDSLPETKISLFLKRNLTPSKVECPLYRLIHKASGLNPEFVELLKKYDMEYNIEYELLYSDEFVKKYESFEIFGKFKISEITYPSVCIVVGHEKEEREIYELVKSRYFDKCDVISCFGKVLERKYDQFRELGPEEFKRVNHPDYKSGGDETDENEEKKQKIENAQKKIADMEDEIKNEIKKK
ncbi:MAG: hypothetical protein FWE78_05825 [Methanimicrococcus sp.]|nr:hypothetical protein [Methanimicrococcus sp.]